MHHAGENGAELLHLDPSFLIAVQLNLLPTGTGSHLFSQMVAVWCHDFFLGERWSCCCSWDRNVVRVASSDVEGWGREVVVMNVVHIVHAMNVVVVHIVHVVVIYDRFRLGGNICDMVIKMIMLFWDSTFWMGICASFCVHLVDLILDEVWHLIYRDLSWPGGARHVIGGEDAEREQGLR